ncbi:MAG: hypothetical protein MUC28_01020 [Planctomycetes bacterium]|jgi:spermidine synthase|nr:hypothetical protein [Planctomycetota bacterium]
MEYRVIDKIIWYGLFFLLGFFSLVAQVALIRELFLSFYFNELWLGVVLAAWLSSTGVGSILAWRFSGKLAAATRFRLLCADLYLSPWFLFGAVVLARAAKSILADGGVMPAFFPGCFYSWLAIWPLGFFLGLQFFWAGSLWRLALSAEKNPGRAAAVRGYIAEAAGFLAGALTFNFYLVTVRPLFIYLSLALACWAMLFCLATRPGRPRTSWPLAVTISFFVIAFFSVNYGRQFDYATLSWRFFGEQLAAQTDSRLGTTAITYADGQYNAYYNGVFYAASQDNDRYEILAHLPLLLHGQANSALLIGHCFSGLAAAAGHFSSVTVDCLEPDAELYNTAARYFPESNAAKRKANLNMRFFDSRYYLRNTDRLYDVIILGQANPATLADNRHFTSEFFALAASRLTERGILAFALTSTPNYAYPAQLELLSSVFATLRPIFRDVSVSFDNEILFLASPKAITPDRGSIRAAYEKNGLKNRLVTPAYIDWRLDRGRAVGLESQLQAEEAKINSDWQPVASFYEQALFWRKMSPVRTVIRFWPFVLAALAVILIPAYRWKKQNSAAFTAVFLSMIVEFCLMTLEIILILLYETNLGILYAPLTVIIAFILGGIAAGGLAGQGLLARYGRKRVLPLAFSLIFIAFLLPAWVLYCRPDWFMHHWIYYLLSFIAGAAAGVKFPVLSDWYLASSPNLAAIYGYDLLGGAAGALLAGVWLIPAFGIVNLFWAIAVIPALGLGILLVKRA